MVEFADLFEGRSQLVVVVQPAAHFLDLFAAQTELTGAAASIRDSQNRKRMSAAGGADRATAAVAHSPLHQRTTQDLSGHRQHHRSASTTFLQKPFRDIRLP